MGNASAVAAFNVWVLVVLAGVVMVAMDVLQYHYLCSRGLTGAGLWLEGAKVLAVATLCLAIARVAGLRVRREFQSALGVAQLLRQPTEEVCQAAPARETDLAKLRHDLLSPLNAASGFLELLESDVSGSLNSRQQSYVYNVRKGINRLLEIAKSLGQPGGEPR